MTDATATAAPATPAEEVEWTTDHGRIFSTYSAMQLHRKCAQAWLYRYDQGLREPDTAAAPLRDMGSWWSAWRAAEALERGRRLGSLIPETATGPLETIEGAPPLERATATAAAVVDAARDWWDRQTPAFREAVEEELREPLPDRLQHLGEAWTVEWAAEREHEAPLAVEVRWERVLPRPADDAEWDALAGTRELPEVRLFGFIDEIYRDTRRGMVVVRDHKTAKAMKPTSALDDLLDSQLHLYAWGITPWIKAQGLPAPSAVAYDRSRSPRPTEPRLTATGTLSKSVSDYDLTTYLRWARTDTRPTPDEVRAEHAVDDQGWAPPEIVDPLLEALSGLPAGQFWGTLGDYYKTGKKAGEPKFGVYEIDPAHAEALSTEVRRSAWHQRTLRPLSPHVVRAHLRSAVDTVTDIHRTRERARRTGEAARSYSRMNCGWCPYVDLCRAQMVGGPQGEYDPADFGLVNSRAQR